MLNFDLPRDENTVSAQEIIDTLDIELESANEYRTKNNLIKKINERNKVKLSRKQLELFFLVPIYAISNLVKKIENENNDPLNGIEFKSIKSNYKDGKTCLIFYPEDISWDFKGDGEYDNGKFIIEYDKESQCINLKGKAIESEKLNYHDFVGLFIEEIYEYLEYISENKELLDLLNKEYIKNIVIAKNNIFELKYIKEKKEIVLGLRRDLDKRQKKKSEWYNKQEILELIKNNYEVIKESVCFKEEEIYEPFRKYFKNQFESYEKKNKEKVITSDC